MSIYITFEHVQSSHTQLVLNQVVYLNYRNENMWPPIRKWLQILEAFHLASAQIITFDLFEQYISFLRSVLEIFDISTLRVSLWLFEHHTFQFKMSLSLFPSKILVCAMAFAAQNLFFFLRFTFGELYCKNIKIKVGRYIGISLWKYQDYQDYWPIIHDKLEDLFTTITHSFQDFSHTEKCAYITS